MTDDEIQGLIAFGREVAKRRLELGLTFKEFSEKTKTDDADAISAGYLGEICGVGEGRSQKRFRITPFVIEKIASALNWDKDAAIAIYQQNASADPEPIEVLAMGIAEQAKMYSPERQAAIKAMLENVKKAAGLLGDDK